MRPRSWLMLSEPDSTTSTIHGDPSNCPSGFGSSKDGFSKRLDGAGCSVVVETGMSEVVVSTV